VAFHEDRANILVREGAAFLGLLQHIAQHIPWCRHTFVAIQRSFINAVHVAQVSTNNMKKFINAFKLLEELPTTENRAYHEFIAKQKSHCIFKSGHHNSDFRDDIRLITQLTTEHQYRVTPIAHVIPRVHDFTAYCESCEYGAGGYSSDLGFICHIEWPIDKQGLDELIQDTTHINILEHASLLITYAMAQVALQQRPFLATHQHPTITIFTDNKTAESWAYKAISSSSHRVSKYISKLACALQINSSLGLNATYLEGSRNVIADRISRITNNLSFDSQLQAIQQEFEELRSC